MNKFWSILDDDCHDSVVDEGNQDDEGDGKAVEENGELHRCLNNIFNRDLSNDLASQLLKPDIKQSSVSCDYGNLQSSERSRGK